MSVIIEYFTAASDNEAATIIDVTEHPPPNAFDAPDIDPVVALGVLEEILTGRSFDEILDDPQICRTVASRNDDAHIVVAVSPTLVAALAAATPESLDQVAQPWSQTEEFGDAADPLILATFLHQFAVMARTARATGTSVYCRLIT